MPATPRLPQATPQRPMGESKRVNECEAIGESGSYLRDKIENLENVAQARCVHSAYLDQPHCGSRRSGRCNPRSGLFTVNLSLTIQSPLRDNYYLGLSCSR